MTKERFLELDNRIYSNEPTLEDIIELITDYCQKKGKDNEWIAKLEQGLMTLGMPLLMQAALKVQQEYEREFNVTKIQKINTQQTLMVY